MLEKRVKIQSVVESQLPDFLRSESQRTGDFLKTYYKSVEYQGGSVNILENIDQYTKVGTYTSIVGITSITADVDATDETITVSSTTGWPDTYGLLKINDEIISYTGKTATTFTGCIRGFSGITSYRGTSGPDELIFEESIADDHLDGAYVTNVSSLFLKEFFRKLKAQFLPGFENRELNEKVNAANFLRQSKDFYSAKGTENAFEILFKGLYGEEIKVIKPQDYLFIPSDAGYRRVLQLVVEALEGDPKNLASQTVYQTNEDGEVLAFGSVVDVEEINRGGTTFYRINIDFDYNVDSSVFGSVFGEFRIDPFSKVIGNVAAGATFVTVDSTVGFATTGALTVNFDATTAGIITYTSKTTNQFFGCVGINSVITDKTEIAQNVSSYGYDKDGEQITFRAKGALGGFTIEGNGRDVPLFKEKDVIELQSLGVDKDDIITDSLVQNITSKLQVKTIKADGLNFIVETFSEHNFRVPDSIEVVDNLGNTYGGGIIGIESDTQLTCNGLTGIQLDGTRTFVIRKRVQTQLGMFLSDVSASYFDEDDNVYVACNSLPTYSDKLDEGILTLSGTYTGDTIEYVEHGLITGEEVYYVPDVFVEVLTDYGDDSVAISTISNLGDLEEGTYFAKRVDINNFQLANSRTDIAQDNYLSIAGIASAQQILPILSQENSVDATKQITRIPAEPTDSATFHETQPGITGIFVNGVDILNYKSEDYVYHGNITELPVVNPGEDYDVINPPTVIIDDSVGTGATAVVAVTGSLKKIEVLDAGSDFITLPVIEISGGNGEGAEAKGILKYEKVVNFVETTPEAGYISTANNTVGFATYHRLRIGDSILYDNNDQTAIGIGSTVGSKVRDASLVKNTTYFAQIVDLSTIKLHNKVEDAIAGINTINLTAYGTGNHIFTSVYDKGFLSYVSIENEGSGYKNNKIEVKPTGISTSADTVTYTKHGFNDGDLVTYAFNGTAIAGLTTDQQYYVLKQGEDSFKLAAAGIGTTLSRTNYDNKTFVDFTSVGVGTHIFNDPAITVSISGIVGIATTNSNTFQPTIQPHFRGSLTKINITEGGTGYGSSDIINFEKQSLVTFENGADAQTKPIIVDGVIKEVLVTHGGYGYKAAPNLKIEGNGTMASLAPILTDGVLTGVKINDGGVGYTTATTFVSVVPSGKGASVRTRLTSWNINMFERYKHRLTGDDGILYESLNDNSSGTFASATVPRELRKNLYAKKNDGQRRYGQFDLVVENGVEQKSVTHSPIVGWAFDGHPIYGPYGYDTPSGGAVRALQSGYTKISNDLRPSQYELGFFVEDYQFTNSGDLDERNGRFGRTPDYPNGIYAYFTTINDGLTESAGPFRNYKLPIFPYVIGKYYKSQPDDFNFDRKNNQVEYNYEGIRRNTKSSKVNSEYGGNDYLSSTIDDINQVGEITGTHKGSIFQYGVVAAGTSYKSREYLQLDQPSPAFGQTCIARVDRVGGKKIVAFASSTITANNVEFFVENGQAVGYGTEPHGFENRDLARISGLSTSDFASVAGLVRINNSLHDQKTWYLESGIGTVGATGLTTTISFLGPYDPITVRENTIIGIGTTANYSTLEQLKVLNVDPLNHRMRVQREYNNTTGAAYSSRTLAIELPSTINFSVGFGTFTSNPPTFQRYFNPSEVIGLGTEVTVGIGTTITYQQLNNIAPPNKLENSNYSSGIGATSQIIPISTILIPNHSFETGDKLTYSSGGGTAVQVSNGSTFTLSDGSTVYAIKESSDLLGISTTKVGLGSTGTFVGLGSTAVQLSFTTVGSGVTHSFKLDSSPLTGSVHIHGATFTTKEPHGLLFRDRIDLSVTPGFTTDVFVEYNPYNRKMTFYRRAFAASDVDTTNNKITLNDHGLLSGDKVIFTTGGTAPTGLTNNGEYYAIYVDNNTFQLASTLRNSNGNYPVPLRISAGGSGEHLIAKITPRISAIIGTKVAFALTDSSLSFNSGGNTLPAFTMKFYKDVNFNDQFISSKATRDFEVTGVGTVGVSDDAKTTLSVNQSIPLKLFYKFEAINTDIAPFEQTDIIVDREFLNSSTIEVQNSVYTATEFPIGIGSTTFTYLLKSEPEKPSYGETDGVFTYTTNSSNATGPIRTVEVLSSGSGYDTMPGITSIKTTEGSGAILRPLGSVGRILTSRLKDTGYDYPSDPTLKVFANVPEVLLVEELCSIDEVGITSGGRNYLTPPSLVVIDKFTDKVVDDILLESKIKNGTVVSVDILNNTKTLSDTPPKIISINNSNGVGIQTVGFNTMTKEVDVYFDVGFSTAGTFPFSVGDKVYVENVGIASTGSGYNSVDYNYRFFELTSVDENIGGIGSVTYQLDGDAALAIGLTEISSPGLYTTDKSYGRMIPPQDLPIYAPTLKKNDFSVGEVVSSDSARGTVSIWDAAAKTLKVNSKNDFKNGEIVTGQATRTAAKVLYKYNVDSHYDIEAAPLVIKGWTKDTGKLNDATQRMIDSDYYQYFSYSLKSKIAYETWEEVVDALNHTAGFKKFSDLIIESESDKAVSPAINLAGLDTLVELESDISTYSTFDFDYVVDKTLDVSKKEFAKEILFQNKSLTDFEESVGNRVLTIDDFSDTFNSDPRAEKFSVVDVFPISLTRYRKYIISINDTKFVDNVQTSIVEILIGDDGQAFVSEYADVDTNLEAFFEIRINGQDGELLFYPENFSINSYAISGLAINIERVATQGSVGLSTIVGINTIADIATLQTRGTQISAGITTAVNILSFSASDYNSGKYLIQAQQDDKYQTSNISVLTNGSVLDYVEYGQIYNGDRETTAGVGLGTFGSTLSGGTVYINFTPNSDDVVGSAVTFNVLQTNFHSGVSTLGIGTSALQNGLLVAGFTTISASGSPGITTIASFTDPEDGAYAYIEVEDLTNNHCSWTELTIVGNENGSSMTEFGILETNVGLGTFGAEYISDGKVDIRFTPNASIITNVRTFLHTTRPIVSSASTIYDLDIGNITNLEGSYEGTEVDVLRAFGLFHQTEQIFTRNIDASDSDVVDLTDNVIIIPNHFFVTGERITYTALGTGTTSHIGIATTTVSGISTDKLPNDLYAIKLSEKSLQFAGSASDALAATPVNFDLTSVGIGTSHVFQAHDQNSKVILALDNNIQDPVVSTGVTHVLLDNMTTYGEQLRITGITSIFGADLLKIEDEFVKIKTIGIGSTNSLLVQRGWMGTASTTHSIGAVATKFVGGYNIVDNTLNFYTAPHGPKPSVVPTDPDEIDWTGIQTHSTFQGRTFLRSGVTGASTMTYSDNYIFDSISDEFTGIGKTFTLKVNGENVSGFSTDHALLCINDIAQGPSQGSRINDFSLEESAGISSVVFSGFAASVTSDINTGTVPVGGTLVSVGSSDGYGYQPLIGAGGTAIISGFGTVQSISLGNTGSGYRAGIQTVNLDIHEVSYTIGVRTNSDSVTSIGTVTIAGGHVTGVALTAPYSAGTGYTFTSPPEVIIQEPLSYSDIPLIYHGDNPGPGIGSNARATIIVSQDSTVKAFNLTNNGYGYREDEIITVPVGGVAGIPTNTSITDLAIGYGLTDYPVYAANYTPSTGAMVLDIGTHSIPSSGIVTIANESLVFTCSKDNYLSKHAYPRSTDPAYGQALTVSAITANQITVNVGVATDGIYPHSFVGAGHSEFRIHVEIKGADKFSSWHFGKLDVFDKLDSEFDGNTKVFTLKKNTVATSIKARFGSLIDVEKTLLIFINDVLQEPGQAFTFRGGSQITFTEAPKAGDTSKVLFYKGTGDLDVVTRDVMETIKQGDTVRIEHGDLAAYYEQEDRVVSGIITTDTLNTSPYIGPGLTTDTTVIRPLTWTKQTEDVIVNGIGIGKDRSLLEPNIYPNSTIIQPVGVGSTEIWVDNVIPLFNSYTESMGSEKATINIYSQDDSIGAAATAQVSGFGTISSFDITTAGVGYTIAPTVTVANPVGLGTTFRAEATASITGTAVTSITIGSTCGSGYTFTNPPQVLISQEQFDKEQIGNVTYTGDFGIISGVGTTTVGVASTGLVFDFIIPKESSLRSTGDMGPGAGVTLSGINTGYYFVVSNSNIGGGTTSLKEEGTVVGIGTSFLDNVYQAVAVSVATSEAYGMGSTQLMQVTVSLDSRNGISGYGHSEFFGEYSWGRLTDLSRAGTAYSFSPYLNNGLAGISTSPIVIRKSPLKSVGYLT